MLIFSSSARKRAVWPFTGLGHLLGGALGHDVAAAAAALKADVDDVVSHVHPHCGRSYYPSGSSLPNSLSKSSLRTLASSDLS